jgi:hypothetical protein
LRSKPNCRKRNMMMGYGSCEYDSSLGIGCNFCRRLWIRCLSVGDRFAIVILDDKGYTRGNPRRMYSTPFTYKSRENPTSLLDIADESSANAEATSFKPAIRTFDVRLRP